MDTITKIRYFSFCVIFFLLVSMFFMCKKDRDDITALLKRSDHLGLTTVSSSWIPDDEISGVMMAAVKGDGEAALSLRRHFYSVLLDYYTGLFWATIGAENDYPEAQYSLVIPLIDNKIDKYFNQRGVFWLQKMAYSGYRDTLEWLEREGYTLETALPPGDELFKYTYKTLSEYEMFQCKEGAIKGSGKAALILAQYHSKIARDTVSAEYWYKIGAQNGNVECEYQYGYILSKKQDVLDRERGKFWIKRARKNGYKL